MVVIFDKYNTLYRKKSINLDEKEYLCTALITLRIMKKEWNDVREFHEKFGHPVAEEPRMIDRKRALSRGKWMNEEVAEFLIADSIYEQADAMIDLMYFALGTLVEMGLEADELFDIVQKANMAKLWPDGKPHYNPKDGKVIKPEGWEDPAPKIRAYIDSVIAAKTHK
jgi:predicted HAD superfamily Cof-like phosphohydrolase